MYIFHRDRTGRRFVDLLASRARAGVKVRVAYDWFGCGLGPALGLFRPLIQAGGEVRVFNPPSFRTALGWIRRNHRKLITVDSRVAFVSGLCIGEAWEGIPSRGLEPWRDTGVEIIGPAVAAAEQSFADSWRLAGGAIDAESIPDLAAIAPAGEVALRLIPTEPFAAHVLRLDLLVSALARHRLWITDAYFIGTGAYLDALCRAAQDKVDVRILLPQGSDVGWTVPVSRSLYRQLLEAGVRIFEWNGTMVHAKTAVADSRWARIGSTNLNVNSWLGNWELDVAIEHEATASQLEAMYLEDLARSTEIVAATPRRIRPVTASPKPPRGSASSRRMLRTVTGVGRTLGAAVTGNRQLEGFEVIPVLAAGIILLTIALTLFLVPRLVAFTVAAITAWSGVTFLAEAVTLWRRNSKR
jgi:phosphatidylserine/phosphatidylglycerophosphate/cardiolipin synthase-like enzyme